MISIQAAINLVIYCIVVGLIFWLLSWLLNYINPPEPFKKVANVILTILGVLVIIGILLSLVGGTPIFIR